MKNLLRYGIIELCNYCSAKKENKMNIQESIAKLEEERDMYWHMFISSREKGYSSQTDREEGYPSKEYFLSQYLIRNKQISNLKANL